MMSNKKISIGYATSENEEDRNFGDELARYIVERIANKKAINLLCKNRLHALFYLIKKACRLKITFETAIKLYSQIVAPKYLLSVGSILHYFNGSGGHVWGSGIIEKGANVKAKHKFYLVRGPYTRSRLLDLGHDVPEIYGDPALILPDLYHPTLTGIKNLLLIPHVIHYQEVLVKFPSHNILNLATSNVEHVINEICSSKLNLSSSLHGLIVSHAYGVPALWVNFSNKDLDGDGVKFLDYFSSVDIHNYDPIDFEVIKLSSNEEIVEIFNHKLLPNIDLNKIREDIRRSFPQCFL